MARPSEQLLDRREQRWYRRLAGLGHVQLSVQGYDADNLLIVPSGYPRPRSMLQLRVRRRLLRGGLVARGAS
jgi:hypothetical protein